MSSFGRRLYLDYNATAPLLCEARDAVIHALDLVGNPSSVHSEGRAARRIVDESRREVAALVASNAENVTFTSSATEAAATCLTSDWVVDGTELTLDALAVLDTDHAAIREGGRFEAGQVSRLGVDRDGIVDLASLDVWVKDLHGRPGMLALCLANGETGVIQPLDAIRERLAGHRILLVLDIAQAGGRMVLSLDALGADAVILSGHKIGAAKGVGAFVLGSEHTRPFRLLSGGGQEKGLRSGTEAVPAIASFGAAARIARNGAATFQERFRPLRDRLSASLSASIGDLTVLGEGAERLANTLSLVVRDFKAETGQIALDLEGFAISAGSACSSGKVETSHVLAAMARGGLDVDPRFGLVRVSFGADASAEDLDLFAAGFARVVTRTRPSAGDLRAA